MGQKLSKTYLPGEIPLSLAVPEALPNEPKISTDVIATAPRSATDAGETPTKAKKASRKRSPKAATGEKKVKEKKPKKAAAAKKTPTRKPSARATKTKAKGEQPQVASPAVETSTPLVTSETVSAPESAPAEPTVTEMATPPVSPPVETAVTQPVIAASAAPAPHAQHAAPPNVPPPTHRPQRPQERRERRPDMRLINTQKGYRAMVNNAERNNFYKRVLGNRSGDRLFQALRIPTYNQPAVNRDPLRRVTRESFVRDIPILSMAAEVEGGWERAGDPWPDNKIDLFIGFDTPKPVIAGPALEAVEKMLEGQAGRRIDEHTRNQFLTDVMWWVHVPDELINDYLAAVKGNGTEKVFALKKFWHLFYIKGQFFDSARGGKVVMDGAPYMWHQGKQRYVLREGPQLENNLLNAAKFNAARGKPTGVCQTNVREIHRRAYANLLTAGNLTDRDFQNVLA